VGPVDVVVTNPGGGTARLVGGLIYAPVESFNFNAVWDGYRAESETPAFSFTVVNNALTSVTCRTALPIVLSPEVPVVNGTFSFSGADGTSMSGSIVADGQSTGTINLPVCGAMEWFGFRR
jgi:hypothetical protein